MSRFEMPKKKLIPFNYFIKAEKVFVLDQDGNNLGQMYFNQAMQKAKEASLDLVQISAGQNGIPTCKICDVGKYKFELEKREKEQAKKQRESEIKTKEMTLRPVTADNDLEIKARKIKEFLAGGDKVRIAMRFKKGRELDNSKVGKNTFDKLMEFIGECIVESKPTLDGQQMVAMIRGVK
jgi:translation initiation factor IF-3